MEISNPFEIIIKQNEKIIELLLRIEGEAKKEPDLLSIKDFCKEMSITADTAYAWRRQGKIEVEQIGRRLFVKRDSVKVKKHERL